jgi:hypothetical protein
MASAKQRNGGPKTAGDLRPSPSNPRTISDDKLAMLGKSLAEFGDLSGICVNLTTGDLVGGHQRLKHLDPAWKITKRPATDKTGTVALGTIATPWGELGYREVRWPVKKEASARVAANQHGGEWDIGALTDFLRGVDQSDYDLLGFAADDVTAMLADAEPPTDFKSYDENISVDHVCPKCGFRFSAGATVNSEEKENNE